LTKFFQGFVLATLFNFACDLSGGFEYLYPVANLRGDFFLMMYQKSLTDLEVWIYDASSSVGCKELSAFYFPSCVKLLLDKSGFSFIDRGKIRIKYFEKRAVHTVSIPNTIFRVSFMQWIDKNSFYMTAQESEFNKTYLCFMQDHEISTICLQEDISAHFLYPSIFNHELFCVQRSVNAKYKIVKKDDYLNKSSLWQSLYESEQPICSLHVNQDKKIAFFVALLEEKENSALLRFACFSLKIGHELAAKLFEFYLPKALITGLQEERMFESLTPFLPCILNNFIYFVHADPICSLYSYDLEIKTTQKMAFNYNSDHLLHCFAPCLGSNVLTCGLGGKDLELIDPVSSHCLVGKIKKDD
jgi:hypothetical protein